MRRSLVVHDLSCPPLCPRMSDHPNLQGSHPHLFKLTLPASSPLARLTSQLTTGHHLSTVARPGRSPPSSRTTNRRQLTTTNVSCPPLP